MFNSIKFRQYAARVLIPIFAVWAVLMPSTSYAFVPAGVYIAGAGDAATLASATAAGGGVGSGGAAAAMAGAGAVGLGLGALAVGMALGYLIVDNLAGDLVRVPLTTANPVPAPSAPATAPAGAPDSAVNPAGFNGGYRVSCNGTCGTFGANDGTISACYTNYGLSGNPTHACVAIDSTTHQCYEYNGGGAANISTSPDYASICTGGQIPQGDAVGSCPSGYASDGSGGCTLTDPRAASPDHACDYQWNGSSLVVITDPDCAAVANPLQGGKISGVDANGNPYVTTITQTADGGSTVTTQTQTTTTTGTQVQTTTVTVDGTGHVTSLSGDVQVGSISFDPTTGTGTATTTGQTPASTGQTTFPSDYARTGEAAAASTGIVDAINAQSTKLDTLHNDLSTTTTVTDPTVPADTDMPTFGNSFNDLLGWKLPAHVSTCPQPSVDLSSILGPGHVYTMTSHCDLMNNNASVIQGAMTIVFTVLALFIVLRA